MSNFEGEAEAGGQPTDSENSVDEGVTQIAPVTPTASEQPTIQVAPISQPPLQAQQPAEPPQQPTVQAPVTPPQQPTVQAPVTPPQQSADAQPPQYPFSPQPRELSQNNPPPAQHSPLANGPAVANLGQQVPFQAQQPYQASSAWVGAPVQQYPKSGNAPAALIISGISIFLGFMCGIGFIGSPIGAFLGYRELGEIDSGQVSPSNRGIAIAAIVIGVIGTIPLLGIAGIFFFALLSSATP